MTPMWPGPHAAIPPTRRRTGLTVVGIAVVATIAMIGGAMVLAVATVGRADRASVLFVIEDGRGAASVGGERRADSLIVATWLRSCDTVRLTSIPRELTIPNGAEHLGAQYQLGGARHLADRIEDVLDVRIGAIVTTDLHGVEEVSAALDPVTIDLPYESRDERTGFHAGPGVVPLVGSDAVDFLRSRTFEQRVDGEWVMYDVSDLGRIARTQQFVRAALDGLQQASGRDIVGAGEAAIRHAHLDVTDALALAGFAAGARAHHGLVMATLPVTPERSTGDRRSPFAPDEFGAAARVRLADPDADLVTCSPEETS